MFFDGNNAHGHNLYITPFNQMSPTIFNGKNPLMINNFTPSKNCFYALLICNGEKPWNVIWCYVNLLIVGF